MRGPPPWPPDWPTDRLCNGMGMGAAHVPPDLAQHRSLFPTVQHLEASGGIAPLEADNAIVPGQGSRGEVACPTVFRFLKLTHPRSLVPHAAIRQRLDGRHGGQIGIVGPEPSSTIRQRYAAFAAGTEEPDERRVTGRSARWMRPRRPRARQKPPARHHRVARRDRSADRTDLP